MPKDKRKKRIDIASVYSRLKSLLSQAPGGGADEVRQAASQLRSFGLECDQFINDKLKRAQIEELRFLLPLVRHLESQEIGEGLREIVMSRSLPLTLKLEFFEAMAELGFSLDSDFLKRLNEAQEIFFQLNAHLESGQEEGFGRARALAADFLDLPLTLKISFLQELQMRDGDRALPFLLQVIGAHAELDSLIAEIAGGRDTPQAAELLKRIAEAGSDKNAVKYAKRALYRLREKGVYKPPEGQEAGIKKAEEDSALKGEGEQAFSTNIDTFGERLLLLVLPTLREALVCRGVVDQMKGILEFFAQEMPRKQQREYIKKIEKEVESDGSSYFARIDPEHCRALFEEAYRRNAATGALVPSDYKLIRYRIKPEAEYDPARAVRETIDVTENDVRSVSAKLEDIFSIPEISIWLAEKETLLPYAARFVELAESKLVIDEQQRQRQMDDAVADFTADYFNEERLGRLLRRLQETALLLFWKGRKEQAGLLAALAQDLGESSFLKPHKFLMTFLVNSLVITIEAMQHDKERRTTGGKKRNRIIRPGQDLT